MSAQVRPAENEDARRELAVEMFKRHARAARPSADYNADIEYLENAVLAFENDVMSYNALIPVTPSACSSYTIMDGEFDG